MDICFRLKMFLQGAFFCFILEYVSYFCHGYDTLEVRFYRCSSVKLSALFYVCTSVHYFTWIRCIDYCFFFYCFCCSSLHKICQNAGLSWLVFSHIRTESTTLSLYGKIRVRENPYSGILHKVLFIIIIITQPLNGKLNWNITKKNFLP